MNKYLIFGFFLLYNNMVAAQTVIFGEAPNPNGTKNEFFLEQPDNAPNPLGNPIVAAPSAEPAKAAPSPASDIGSPKQQPSAPTPSNVISEDLPINPQPSEKYDLQKEQSMIQDKLYEGYNRIYDVQSIPIEDIKKIEVPDIEPTITTYPIY